MEESGRKTNPSNSISQTYVIDGVPRPIWSLPKKIYRALQSMRKIILWSNDPAAVQKRKAVAAASCGTGRLFRIEMRMSFSSRNLAIKCMKSDIGMKKAYSQAMLK